MSQVMGCGTHATLLAPPQGSPRRSAGRFWWIRRVAFHPDIPLDSSREHLQRTNGGAPSMTILVVVVGGGGDAGTRFALASTLFRRLVRCCLLAIGSLQQVVHQVDHRQLIHQLEQKECQLEREGA